jgi:serine/threonine-protein kinase HipA
VVSVARTSNTPALSIWANGERVGIWRIPERGADELLYDEAWVGSQAGRPLSLSLPLVGGFTHKGAVVKNYFDNLLPDSQPIRERIASRFRTRTAQSFDLLQAIGRDCVGAIQLLGEDDGPSHAEHIEGEPMTEADVEKLLQQTVDPGRFAGQSAPEDELRISLAGAQEKTALLWHQGQWVRPHGSTPTTHILKLPLGLVGHRKADFSTSVENEWLCLNILQEYGIPVPLTAMLRFGSQKVLAVERFDRRLHSSGNWWLRLPQEDFCQALGKPSHLKYEADGGPGLIDLADVLRSSVNAQKDLATLLTVQLLFWMLGAPDGHAKNFSIAWLPMGRYRLTPIYDVMSIWPVEGNGPNQFSKHEAKLAMALIGKRKHYPFKTVQRRHFNAMAQKCHYGPDAENLIERVLAATPGVIERVGARLPSHFPAAVSGRILEGLARSAKALGAMPSF